MAKSKPVGDEQPPPDPKAADKPADPKPKAAGPDPLVLLAAAVDLPQEESDRAVAARAVEIIEGFRRQQQDFEDKQKQCLALIAERDVLKAENLAAGQTLEKLLTDHGTESKNLLAEVEAAHDYMDEQLKQMTMLEEAVGGVAKRVADQTKGAKPQWRRAGDGSGREEVYDVSLTAVQVRKLCDLAAHIRQEELKAAAAESDE